MPTPRFSPPWDTRYPVLVQKSNYQGLASKPFNNHVVPTVDGVASFAQTASGSSAILKRWVAGRETASYTVAGMPPTSPFTAAGVTITPSSSAPAVRFSDPAFGSGVLWIDVQHWQICFNTTVDTSRTYSIPLDPAMKPAIAPDDPINWALIGAIIGGIGLGLALPGLLAAVGSLLAVGVTLEVILAAWTAILGYGLTLVAWIIDVADLGAASPYVTPGRGSGWNGGPPLNPPDSGSQWGGPFGSQPMYIQAY